ncbi:MAG: 2,3-bisphosphoglycerate-independent phosphoglycerate mutase [Candidatus Dojkabacteria bacterium]|nr:2,3-bisphosphoglycerate-independent phosphoglycerate mutase [Candidatus Dojkabacteria bacterium]MDQ7020876.1 2,3-bisphosphoglycerate-independent phosphoglycerate mutase [Candidatus Dojkabacteria bacterium]
MQTINRSDIPKPLVLIILDGLGVADPNKGNAVTLANTSYLDSLWPEFPHTYLEASGNYVGLPKGVTGNSEVGHMSLGAGRIIYQEIAKIDKEIDDGAFYKNEIFLEAIDHARQNKGDIHFMGVASDGRVHSSIQHLYACLEFCKREKIKGDKVFIHAFTDGRDTAPQKAADFLEAIESKTKMIGVGKIASVIGRYYAMDRDDRWDRTKLAYDLLVSGKGTMVDNWRKAVEMSYSENVWDEYLEPYVVTSKDMPTATVKEGDALIFFNYRGDRAVQLSKAFEDPNFYGFPVTRFKNLYFAGFSNYEKGIVMNRATEDVDDKGGESEMVKELFNQELKATLQFPEKQISPPQAVDDSLGRLISDAGLSQLRLAESEKYPHVTYFFNCRKKDIFEREERLEVPSPREVKTYDEKPEMSSYEITDNLVKAIKSKKYDFILVNYALTDMVAHTGNLQASIKAVEVADQCLKRAVKEIQNAGGEAIITADHGNIEELINLITGGVDTKHSVNPVPIIYITKDKNSAREVQMGMLADVAPTLLTKLGLDIPATMVARNLFE